MINIYVGTCGWLYDWNEDGSLDWYIRYSQLNAVELNASFYRFPYRNQVLSWSRRGRSVRWAIKVNRYITHVKRLKKDSLNSWFRFKNLFEPLDDNIDFYLFQLPPGFSKSKENISRIEYYASKTELGCRFAIEFRHVSWFNDDTVDLCKRLGITLVSIDSPIGTWIRRSNNIVYLRMHGREVWYAYDYSPSELESLAKEILSLKPIRIYVFFNNNHWMLDNARYMKKVLEQFQK